MKPSRIALILLAALFMLGTLPGRTFGLGLVTESILAEFDLSRTRYGFINLVTSIAGAGCCLGMGVLVDRFGLRFMISGVLLLLALATIGFASAPTLVLLVICLFLVRGLGQSALSVGSMTLLGKWFTRDIGMAMGLFSIAVSLLFAAAIPSLQAVVRSMGWRPAWFGVAGFLLVLAVLAAAVVREAPRSHAVEADAADSFHLLQALSTPLYWVFSLGSALFNLVVSGVLFFNESILVDQLGMPEQTFGLVMGVFFLSGLGGSLLAGWLLQTGRVGMGRLMGVSLLGLSVSLFLFPFLHSPGQAMAHASLLGSAGGVIPVIFFTCYARAFGRTHLGKIQGSAQLMAVFASASGPLLLGWSRDTTGSYWPPLVWSGAGLACLGAAAWFVRRPVLSPAG